MNIPEPFWCTPEVKKNLRNLINFHYDVATYNEKLKRLSAGPMIKQFLENVEAQETKRSKVKMYLYGGHDTNIAHLLRALGIKDQVKSVLEVPYYVSAIIFEKVRDNKNQIYIKVNQIFIITSFSKNI